MSDDASLIDLSAAARAAAAGDRAAARSILDAFQHDVYGLALRMLGHPTDAEDAAQEILVIVLTHLGSFRGESSLKTWVLRIAVNHLSRARKGRRETITFETLDERLRTGLSTEALDPGDPEREALASELRLRCTEAMILSLDRELRITYILGDVFGLSGEEAAEVLEIEPAAYRKRLSRARTRLHAFLGHWCGVFDSANPCRCAGQVQAMVARGLLASGDLYLSGQQTRPNKVRLHRAADEVAELMRVAEVLRGPTSYLAPEALVLGLRRLLDSRHLELLRD
jgi:RNA polymerase sigma factor (sigma-70 family)